MTVGNDMWHSPCLSITIRTMAKDGSNKAGRMKPCRACRHEISEQAMACPHCGAPQPAREKWDGWGFEYKSDLTLFGLALLHISFKYRPNLLPVPARGIIAVGQFACGFLTLSQFGIGLVSVSQHDCRLRAGAVCDRLFPDRADGALHP